MNVKFINAIKAEQGLTTYALAKRLGVSITAAQHMCGETKGRLPPTRLDLATLVALWKLSGWSEAKFLKALEREFTK